MDVPRAKVQESKGFSTRNIRLSMTFPSKVMSQNPGTLGTLKSLVNGWFSRPNMAIIGFDPSPKCSYMFP